MKFDENLKNIRTKKNLSIRELLKALDSTKFTDYELMEIINSGDREYALYGI